MTRKKFTVGILAHVDAGKTTLSESLLLKTGVIKKAGRVDNKDAYLDTDNVEKERGITIYTKNARIPLADMELILVDTPGHVDFSTEMERSLSVLDMAILLVSGSEGIQSHTTTLWSLLRFYRIPTIIFINKMDMNGADEEAVITQLREKCSKDAVCFNHFTNLTSDTPEDMDAFYEEIAGSSETLMNEYLDNGSISKPNISKAFFDRELFPVFYGSALKHIGIDSLLDGLNSLLSNTASTSIAENDAFAGTVYKISRDKQGKRLSFIKIHSGSLKVKQLLGEENINEIRIYSGEKYDSVSEVNAGELCCLVGLNATYAGAVYGDTPDVKKPVLSPAISYALHYPREIDNGRMLDIMKELGEEDPSLNVEYKEETKEIYVSLMGDVQTEVLKRTLKDRYDIDADFGEGRICYKETIDASGQGVGHFEPLRHYAEVHLLMEPADRGSGLSFATDVSEDILDKNWQRLILTHLQERQHRGVLTGSFITDIKFTLIGGKAHIKHTEGGDFRQATYRAIRQGLMKLMSEGHCVLLEPYYDYTLKVPDSYVGRAMTDISAMNGTCNISENDTKEAITILTGRGPVSALNGYMKEVIAYTRGQGSISFVLAGYDNCHNQEEVLAKSRYNPDSDLRNPSSSVFCMHGAGTVIPWFQVPDYAHITINDGVCSEKSSIESLAESAEANKARKRLEYSDIAISTEEIDSILHQTSHANETGGRGSHKGISKAVMNRNRQNHKPAASEVEYRGTVHKEKYLLVDGYNVIHAWEELSSIARDSLNGAANKLNDILCNYQAITGVHLIVVYDAYKVVGHKTEENLYNNITVVYTRESQTADQYIERYANEHAKDFDITVVTSDGLEQIIIRGEGCHLISSREFEHHVAATSESFNNKYNVRS